MRGEYFGLIGCPHLYAVHPHMRGEYILGVAADNFDDGSPPHAWGILLKLLNVSLLSRFTPTCVGNTSIVGLSPPDIPVHPHMRGEYAPQ